MDIFESTLIETERLRGTLPKKPFEPATDIDLDELAAMNIDDRVASLDEYLRKQKEEYKKFKQQQNEEVKKMVEKEYKDRIYAMVPA